MPKKILIFSLVYYHKYVGGAEVAIKEITDRILPADTTFHIITLNGGGESAYEKIGNTAVYRVLGKVGPLQKLLFPFVAYIKAKKLNQTEKYDMIWSMMASYAGFAGYLYKKKNPATPFLVTLQEGDNFNRREGLFHIFFKKIFTHADRIQVISVFLENWARHMGAKCPIDVVPNGVDISLFSQKKSETELLDLKHKLGKNSDDIFLITTSRLVVKNAVGDIIDALLYLPDNVKFLILGTGYQEKRLREKVEKLGLKDRIHFLGFISHREMPQYLHISDIFIRPALSEGFGLSYIEAMAAGIPVITTPVGGIVDFLRDGETGLMCEVHNPRSIAQKVEKLIKDRESRDYIIKKAFEMVQEKYSWETVVGQMKGVFDLTSP